MFLPQEPHSYSNGASSCRQAQFAIDTELYKAGRAKGYDAIVLLSLGGYARLKAAGRIPLSIELNLLRRGWE